MNSGVALLVRTDVRQRWGRLLLATLLVVGLVGFVAAATVGARRAGSADERAFERERIADVTLEVGYFETEAVLRALRARDDVVAATAWVVYPGGVDWGDRVGRDCCTAIGGLDDAWLDTVYRPVLLEGRYPDPDVPGEMLIPEEAALAGVEVGERAILEEYASSFVGMEPIVVSGEVVGVYRTVLSDALATGSAVVTGPGTADALLPELGRRLAGSPVLEQFRPRVAVILEPGTDIDALAAEVAVAAQVEAPRVERREETMAAFVDAVEVRSTALWVLALTSGLIGALTVGVVLARMAGDGTHPAPSLSALGVTARQSLVVAVAPCVAVLGVGVAGGLMASVLASRWFPYGDLGRYLGARIVVDPVTTLLAAGLLTLGVVAVAVAFYWLDHRRVHHEHREPTGRSLGIVGLPLPVRLGRMLAFQSRSSVWVAAASFLGAVVLTTTAVYQASLDHLVQEPAWSGTYYDVGIFGLDDPEAYVDADTTLIEAAAVVELTYVEVGGETLPAGVVRPLRGGLGPTLTAGRASVGSDEIVLGVATARRTSVSLGDDIAVAAESTRMLRVVGLALTDTENIQAPPGEGAFFTDEAAEALGVVRQEQVLLVVFRDDASVEQRDDLPGFPTDPPERPSLVNLRRTASTTVVVGAFAASLTAAMLALVLVTAAAGRRRDVAVLRALGLRGRQAAAALATMGWWAAIPGAALGVAAGVIAGRLYWSDVAEGLPALARPVVPLGVVLGVIAGAALVAMAALAVPAARQTRRRSAALLSRDLRA